MFEKKKSIFLSALMLLCFFIACNDGGKKETVSDAPSWISGERIPIGASDRRGALAAGISSIPMGSAFVFGNKEPDIFVEATHFSIYPGLYVYHWIARNEDGIPVFGNRQKIHLPDGLKLPNGVIFQTPDKVIHGWWLKGLKIERTVFNANTLGFESSSLSDLKLTGFPDSSRPRQITVLPLENKMVKILVGVNDGTGHRPSGAPNWRSPKYYSFNGAGIYRGVIPFVCLYSSDPIPMNTDGSVALHLYSPTKEETLSSYGSLTPVNLGKKFPSLITGSYFGDILYYKDILSKRADSSKLASSDLQIALRHPVVRCSPMAYNNPKTSWSDLIVGGEGALYYYKFTGNFNSEGAPVYEQPKAVLEEDAKLYTGSLPVINTVDWNNDGALDIVAGNSEGRVIFFRNTGTNERPSFADGEPVYSCDKPIHIQAGYRGSIQGPGEARWGYSCPTIYDWDHDDLPDIVMNSITGRQEVFLNIGSSGKPQFGMAKPIYCYGLNMHGTWRVQPGVKEMGGKTAYVTLDDDDDFHLFWQIDAFNVKDGGKLRLQDSSAIGANFLSAGGTGRSKIVLTDWDGDGITDMLVGTPRHGSIPNPKTGLPQSNGLKGASVLFLKNVGSDKAPVFAFPVLMKFKGKPIYLGQHSCSPAVWNYGQKGGPDLLVGEQAGRIRFYHRKDLSW